VRCHDGQRRHHRQRDDGADAHGRDCRT
jgi:hypothetical protein